MLARIAVVSSLQLLHRFELFRENCGLGSIIRTVKLVKSPSKISVFFGSRVRVNLGQDSQFEEGWQLDGSKNGCHVTQINLGLE